MPLQGSLVPRIEVTFLSLKSVSCYHPSDGMCCRYCYRVFVASLLLWSLCAFQFSLMLFRYYRF